MLIETGGRWPDGALCGAGNALIRSREADPADTLLPRPIAAGADKARCFFVSGTRINGEVHSFDPARDMLALEEQAQRIGGIKLLIVDPVVSAVPGDGHHNTEVRRALQPLVDLASRLDAAVIGISHFSKGGACGDPVSRVVGSIAFTTVARVVLVAATVKGEEGEQDRRTLATLFTSAGRRRLLRERQAGEGSRAGGEWAQVGNQVGVGAIQALRGPAQDEYPMVGGHLFQGGLLVSPDGPPLESSPLEQRHP